nr:hypothetical protein [Pseudodesulfovibrio sp.]
MLPKLTQEQWAEIHSKEFVSTPECWTSCNGGACCNMGLVSDIQFNILPNVGTTLIFMEDEYRYFNSQSMKLTHPIKTLEMNFADKETLTIHTAHCDLNGRCTDCFPKPLLCKMYPYVPIVTLDNSLETILSGSIYDWTFEVKEWASFCPSFGKKDFFYTKWSKLVNEISLLSHPYLVFYSQVIKIFHTSYVDCLRANKRLMDMEGPAFWKNWELAYLTGKLFAISDIKKQVKTLYKQIVQNS